MQDSELTDAHKPCSVPQEDGTEGCGSSDAMSIYSDGHSYCFSCGRSSHPLGHPLPKDETPTRRAWKPYKITYKLPLSAREIDTPVMRKFSYGQGEAQGDQWAHITDLRNDEGEVVGQKMRFKDKTFAIHGTCPSTFWGQHLFNTGKKLVITEGELDAMSVSQIFDNRYPVVSLPSGARSAKRTIQANLRWLDGFDEIIICFDQDEEGQKAARVASKLLPPGKAKLAKLPLKDANAMLIHHKGDELKRAIYDAAVIRPETIVNGDYMWEEVTRELPSNSISYSHTGLQSMLCGLRPGEITVIGAGTGIGKTTLVKEIAHDTIVQGDKIGGIFLEESVRATTMGLLTTFLDIPIHMRMMEGPSNLPSGELHKYREAFQTWIRGRVELFRDQFISPEDLISHIRYMKSSLFCDTIIFDHITMMANLAQQGQERTLIDNTMNKIACLVNELDIRMIILSHLSRPKGRSHEEGAPVRIGDFRGSTQIAALADNVIGLERNQQHTKNSAFARARVLKCRATGMTGIAGWFEYSLKTGRLLESDEPAGGLDELTPTTQEQELY